MKLRLTLGRTGHLAGTTPYVVSFMPEVVKAQALVEEIRDVSQGSAPEKGRRARGALEALRSGLKFVPDAVRGDLGSIEKLLRRL